MPHTLTIEEKEKLVKLGNKVKEIRESKGLSLSDVAHRIGKDKQSVHKFEKGQFNPTYIYLLSICEGLEIDIWELLRL